MSRKKKMKNQRPSSEICLSEGVQNAASTLLANIRFSSVDMPIQTIAVTSSVPNEGKTTVAVALAAAIGSSGGNCLVMEGDMRRRSLRSVFNAKPQYGLYALLSGNCSFKEAVVGTEFPNVNFLDAEAGISNPDSILNSKRYGELLEILAQHYDYIIIDTPPATAFPDASIIASKTDGVVLVARQDFTEKRDIAYSLDQLDAAGANVLGVSFNCVTGESGSGYGYYYGYYYEKKKVKADSPEAIAARGKHSQS